MNKQIIRKIRVNHLLDGYWIMPSMFSILTPRISKYIVKKAKTLDEIIEYNNLEKQEVIFSFNKDTEFKKFNYLLKKREIDFVLDKKIVNNLTKETKFEFEVVPNLTIILNWKSIKSIYNGLIFFFSKEYFLKLLVKEQLRTKKEKISLLWTSMGFKVV
ncbi:MPN499 family protein [Mycoplasma sp. 1654_15]|uniref:MPN499 family protein n=1 Tax=Mycoplasma sp. 1654_15 TaxID=2725994 RepID=UPI001448F183|nr:hypothetical protein [Mycoplasma sp. 1654_15]QJB71153.1 hypothetical protein HF996_01435 [Mycoplasma sp. 1654_15]